MSSTVTGRGEASELTLLLGGLQLGRYAECCNAVTVAMSDLGRAADEASEAMQHAAMAMDTRNKPHYRRLEGKRW